jgi:23S rRNA (cytidine1920-2'-O)/16S rRNA (cytidine1409-2'-O)-methyltransferase
MPVKGPTMHARRPKLRLDELLVERGLAENRSQAEKLVLAGEVFLGDQVSDKPGRYLASDAPIRVRERLPYVSRGGLKLAAALAAFNLRPEGWTCADIGASTGGFTDCLLQHGAARVYAVDVGYGQLAWSLRRDPRVVAIERANIRYLEPLPELVNLATVDVSFIGLSLVLPRVASLLVAQGEAVVLIKPQFEAGKGQVGKGGVVRDPAMHRAVVLKVLGHATSIGLMCAGLIRSPITGPAGNVEFLAWLRRNGPDPGLPLVEEWLSQLGLQPADGPTPA